MNFKTTLYLFLLLTSTTCFSQENSIFHLKNGNIVSGIVNDYDAKTSIYHITSEYNNDINIHQSDITKIIPYAPNQKSDMQQIKRGKITHSNSNQNLKQNEIGVSVFIVAIESEKFTESRNDIVHTGIAGFYNFAFNDHVTSRIIVYEAKSDEESKRLTGVDSRVSGMETQLLLSTNTNKRGWKFYIGGVLFGEVWDIDGNTSSDLLPTEGTHSGVGVIYGLGYNYDSLAIDFSSSIRQKSSYDIADLKMVGSGGLTLSYRF